MSGIDENGEEKGNFHLSTFRIFQFRVGSILQGGKSEAKMWGFAPRPGSGF